VGGLAYSARLRHVAGEANEALNRAEGYRELVRTARGREAADLTAKAREQAQRALALIESSPASAALVARVQGLLAELDADTRTLRLVEKLEAVSLSRAEEEAWEGQVAPARVVPMIREAFREYGLPAGKGEPEAVAAWLGQRPVTVREAIVAALDEWTVLATASGQMVHEPHLEWLRAVQAAAEPGEWGKQVRAAGKGPAPRSALVKFAATVDVGRLPEWALKMLTGRRKALNAWGAVAALLRRAQVRHADVFWVNNELGVALLRQKGADPAEAARYFQAAVALRPDSVLARFHLAAALKTLGKLDAPSPRSARSWRWTRSWPRRTPTWAPSC
jgi:hypothetical protein